MQLEQQTVRDLVATQARRYEKKIFLESGNQRYSYASLDDRTDRVATGISRLGLKKGDRIALILANRPEFVFFLLGAPKIGVVPVLVDLSHSLEEIASVLAHCDVSAVVTESRFLDLRHWVSGAPHWVVIDDESFSRPPFQNLAEGTVLGFWPDLEPEDTALISRTRGTRGVRKAVVLSHRNLLSNCAQLLQPFRINETDRFLCAQDLGSVASDVLLLLAPWAAGGSSILVDAGDVRTLRAIQESGVTVIAGEPRTYQIMAGSPDFMRCDLSSLRLAICHAGAVSSEVLRQFEELHDALIVEGYGLLEATCLTCANPYTGVRKPGSLGIPLPGQECRVLGPSGEELPAGTAGEIVVRGPNVMKGYYRDPEASARVLRDGWLHTGDTGYMDSDGYYYLKTGAPPWIESRGTRIDRV